MQDQVHGTLFFLGFALDPRNERLYHGDAVIDLRPKSMAVLVYLAARPGQLVTKDELLAAVWPDTAVTDWVLTTCVRELRAALGDDSRQPRVIETVHRRGYRFIAETRGSGVGSQVSDPSDSRFRPTPDTQHPTPNLVGRAHELAQLNAWLSDAMTQRRQIAFIAGEAGIGKTTLVDEFLLQLTAGSPVRNPLTPNPITPSLFIARGQCIEQHGSAEPYLPMLDALTRLTSSNKSVLVPLLRRHAPAWLMQLPGLIEDEEAAVLQHRLGAGSRERMLREMAAFVEALPQPLVLVLEDLHWSDHATIDLLSTLAQRRDPARLLLIGSYRPVEVAVSEHPLKMLHHELRAHGRCKSLWLQPLDVTAVGEYLGRRWPGLESIDAVARTVHQRTDGNPLFLVNIASALVDDGIVVETEAGWRAHADPLALAVGVPPGLRQMIAAQSDRLSESEREILTLGSLAGRKFSAALVAAAFDREVLAVEEQLSRLAERGQVVRSAGEHLWPDGTMAGIYEFSHALFQAVLRDRVPPAVRQRHHGRIATRLESAYGKRAGEIAAELAYHFDVGGQPDRAVPYIEEAAERAMRLGAAREAVAQLQRGIALLDSLPTTPERTGQLIQFCIRFGRALPGVQGYMRPEVEAAYERARVLSEQTDDRISLVQALSGLASISIARARFDRAADAIEGVAKLGKELPFPIFVLGTHCFKGMLHYHIGPLADARTHLEAAVALGEIQMPSFSIDPRLVVLAYLASTLLHQGYPDQARARLAEATERALAGGRPFDRANLLQSACITFISLRDYETLAKLAAAAEASTADVPYGTPGMVAQFGRGMCLWATGDTERGMSFMRAGVDSYRSGGHLVALPFLLGSLAFVLVESGDLDGALQPLAEAHALVASTKEQRVEVELHRLDGMIHWRRGEMEKAEQRMRRAIEIAEHQGARWLGLRAATSLARFALAQGRSAARRRAVGDTLARQVASFTEGRDTVDVQAAHELLEQLA